MNECNNVRQKFDCHIVNSTKEHHKLILAIHSLFFIFFSVILFCQAVSMIQQSNTVHSLKSSVSVPTITSTEFVVELVLNWE